MTDNKKMIVETFVHEAFRISGAILENGHFVYALGGHGSVYLDHYEIYTNLEIVSQMCRFMAEEIHYSPIGSKIDVVFGPEGGGIILAYFLGEHLDWSGERMAPLWAKKQHGNSGLRRFVLPQAFEKRISGKKIFLVDDVLTSGGTFRELIELLGDYGGRVVGCGCLWNRGGVTSADVYSKPLFSLLDKPLEDWEAENCPLCKSGIPINIKYGHGKDFIKKTVPPV